MQLGAVRSIASRCLRRDLTLVDLAHWYQLRNSNRAFILGLGNQRCGTTWLYKYMNLSNTFDGGRLKEYHIWDGLDTATLDEHRVVLSKDNPDDVDQLRYRMQQDSNFYFDYFASRYSSGTNLSADITPSYSSLEKPRLKFIKHQFAKQGIPVKALISIRNPVNRIKSAVQFNLDRQNFWEGIVPGTRSFEQALEQYYLTHHCQIRTYYHETIERARSVFGSRNVYVATFESMFSEAEITRLSRFLNIESKVRFGARVENATNTKRPLLPVLENQIRDAYSDVYDYCYSKFPETRRLWS